MARNGREIIRDQFLRIVADKSRTFSEHSSDSMGAMKGYGKEVRDKLERAGWELFYREGDHDVWRNLHTGRKVTVPVNLKSQDIANDILKDAGLPKAF